MPAERRFTVVVEFVTTDQTDAHLTSPAAIEAEVVSWLTDLKATVELIEVAEEKQ